MRRPLTLLLAGWGVQVVEASDSGEALGHLAAGSPRPDALLVDYPLDGRTTGIDAVRRLRGRSGLLPTRIVTANRALEVSRAARRIDVEVLHEPLDP